MLAYHSTPLENGYSPAKLLMGRRIHTTVPIFPRQLNPNLPDINKLKRKEKSMRKRQNSKRHHAKDLKPLQKGDSVWVIDIESEGTVTEEVSNRSYIVQTLYNSYR